MLMSKYYTVDKRFIKSTGRDIKVLIIKPKKNARPQNETPGILWLHGGGYATGMASLVFVSRAINLVKKYGAIVVAPSYRLSIEKAYPGAIEDAYSTLKYMKENSHEIGFNDSQIMVGGESAGGGLTVATCLYARDKGEVNIAYQMPIYPMLDSEETESNQNNHSLIWNTKKNKKAWALYLKNVDEKVPKYASPSRETNYKDLPPAYSFIGTKDAFLSETCEYINNLKRAGVEAKVDIYDGMFHAFDMLFPFKKKSRLAIKNFEENFEFAMKNYYKKQGK